MYDNIPMFTQFVYSVSPYCVERGKTIEFYTIPDKKTARFKLKMNAKKYQKKGGKK